jgi:predicted transcriptional regulator
MEMAKENLPKAGALQSAKKKAATQTSGSTKPKAVSVYLSNKDRLSLEEIARKNNVNRHMLLSYAVRYFLANYRTGHVKLDPTIEAGKVVLSVIHPLDDTDA